MRRIGVRADSATLATFKSSGCRVNHFAISNDGVPRRARLVASATIVALCALTSLPLAAQNAKVGTAIVERAVDAIGGASLVDRIATLSVTTSGSRSTPYGKIKVNSRTYIQFPASFRQEVEFNGQTIAMATSPDGAFLIRDEKVQPVSDAQRHNIEVTALHNPLVMLKGRSNNLFSADSGGEGKIGNVDVSFVDVFVGNEQMRIAVDRSTGRIVQQEFETRGGTPERAGRMLVSYTDFRRIPYGITIPHRSTGRFDGDIAFETLIETITVNDKLREEMFLPGATGESAPPPLPLSPKP